MTDLGQVQLESDEDIDRRIKAVCDVVIGDISEMYEVGNEIGQGRFSVVLQGTNLKEKVQYALKVVENSSLSDEENLEALETEIKILRKLTHPGIVRLKEVVNTPENTYIVMELLAGGELFNRIVNVGCYKEPQAAALFAKIILSMEYLHKQDIVHRDVKPENILFSSDDETKDDIKLIDFGYAGIWDADKGLTGLCGTPDYVAPEVLTWYDDDGSGKPYGVSSDLWSLGVLLYVILSGCSPFSADDEEELLKQVANAQYEFHDAEWRTISAEAKDLISNLLVVDTNARFNMEQVKNHAWVKDAVIACGKVYAAEMASIAAAPPSEPVAAPPTNTNTSTTQQTTQQPAVKSDTDSKKTTTTCSCSIL